jgi:hypothetical protein
MMAKASSGERTIGICYGRLARMALIRSASSICKTWLYRNKTALRSSGFEWRQQRCFRLLDELKIPLFLGFPCLWDDAYCETKCIDRSIAHRFLMYGRSNASGELHL